MKKFAIVLCLLLCVTAFVGCGVQSEPQKTFRQAVRLLKDGNVQAAYDTFSSIKDHPEAAKYLEILCSAIITRSRKEIVTARRVAMNATNTAERSKYYMDATI